MDIRELSLKKSGLTYLFRYVSGREDEVVNEIIRLAEDPSTDIDWLDAARLGFQITQHAMAECYRQRNGAAVEAREGPCSNYP
jgi:hypothetical protein